MEKLPPKKERGQTFSIVLRVMLYLAMAGVLFFGISFLTSVKSVSVSELDEGVADLTAIDFEQQLASLNVFTVVFYESVFYLPADFAAGNIDEATIRIHGDGQPGTQYGTARILVKLPNQDIYALAGKSAFYAQRLFINGKEYPPVGVVADNAAEVTPQTKRYMAAFQPTGELTEIIIHYSNFVHADGGGFYDITLGQVGNVARAEQLQVVRDLAIVIVLLTAMVLCFGIFLFTSKNRYYLWFAVISACIALRGLLVGDKLIMLLWPNLDWFLAIRLEYLATYGTALFFALFIDSLFKGSINKWLLRGFMLFSLLMMAFVCFTSPLIFSKYVNYILIAIVAYLAFLLLAAVWGNMHNKGSQWMRGREKALFLAGCLFFLAIAAFSIYAHRFAIGQVDFLQLGMMVLVFAIILALSLGYYRTESELTAIRLAEQEMEKTNQMLRNLDQLKTDMMANISHELRTPLTVMSGYAQLTARQIDEHKVNQGTQENLSVISREAQRLAQLASGLLQINSEAIPWQRERLTVAGVFERAATVARPLLAKKDNRLETKITGNLPHLYVNGNMIQQVLLNLVVNANQHMEKGVVVFSAWQEPEQKEQFVTISVADNGSSIDPALLPNIFERKVSGSDGSGIGLTICKEIIESHGGTIAVESAPGTGTCVTFTLPIEKRG